MTTILGAVVGYFLLLFVVRVLTRRPGGQMTLFEFVIVFLMGGVIILATVGHDRSVTNCTISVMTIGLLHRTLSWAKTRNDTLGALVDGTPLVLVRDGRMQDEVMHGMRLAPEDILAAGRTKGVRDLDGIQYAVLERNGGISIIKREQKDSGEQHGESN